MPVVRQGAALRRLHRAEAMRASVEAAVSCRSERASEAAVSFRNAPEAVMQPEKSTLATRGIQSCVRSRVGEMSGSRPERDTGRVMIQVRSFIITTQPEG